MGHRMLKTVSPCMQGLPFDFEQALPAGPVFGILYQGMAQGGHVHPNLVRPPRRDLHLHQGIILKTLDDTIAAVDR